MNVNELEGAELDAAVAKALGQSWNTAHAYSTDGSLGGAIIERRHIALTYDKELGWRAYCDAYIDIAGYTRSGTNASAPGPTALVAAMRAYVASEL